MKPLSRDIIETSASLFIQQELTRHSARIRIRGNNATILCPFHSERTPSCSVSLGGTAPPGVFHCWGCKAKGTWSTLAKQIGAAPLPSTMHDVHSVNGTAIHSRLNDMLEDKDSYEWDELLPILSGQPLFEPNADFGNVQRMFLTAFGCKRFLDPGSGEAFLLIPGNINGNTQFLVMARLKRKKRRVKYLSSKRGIGMIGLDEATKLKRWKKHKTLLIVEGPKDALALQQSNIPAVSIGGVSAWDDKRVSALLSVNPKRMCLLFDNDEAGINESRRIVNDYGHKLPLTSIALPSKEELGYKLDPADLGNRAHKYLYERALM